MNLFRVDLIVHCVSTGLIYFISQADVLHRKKRLLRLFEKHKINYSFTSRPLPLARFIQKISLDFDNLNPKIRFPRYERIIETPQTSALLMSDVLEEF